MLDPAQASAVKVWSTEGFMTTYRLLLDVVGAVGTMGRHSPDTVLSGWLENMYRGALVLTFGGGTNEVQRDIIAMTALGLPHYKN